MKNNVLYQALLDRHSVRQYQQEELSLETVALVEEVSRTCKPLSEANSVNFNFLNNLNTADLMTAQGPYGFFVVSPHVVLPYSTSQVHPLVDIGFQAEQFCVRLVEIGLGSCYLGTAGREQKLMRHFNLPESSEMGAAIVFGTPRSQETRSLSNYFRKPGYRTKRKASSELFSSQYYGNSAAVPAWLEEVFHAAQRAPSAVNAQPWRFILKGDWLYLYVIPSVYPFVLNAKNRMTYALHDAGIVMANISLAYEAQDTFRNWCLYEPQSSDYPETPAEVVPVAKIKVVD